MSTPSSSTNPPLFPTNPPITTPPIIEDNRIINSNKTETFFSGISAAILFVIIIIVLTLSFYYARKRNTSMRSYFTKNLYLTYFTTLIALLFVFSLCSFIIEMTADLDDKPDGPNLLYDMRQWQLFIYALLGFVFTLVFFVLFIKGPSVDYNAIFWFLIFALNAILCITCTFFTIFGFTKLFEDDTKYPFWIIFGIIVVMFSLTIYFSHGYITLPILFSIAGIVGTVLALVYGDTSSLEPEFYIESNGISYTAEGYKCTPMTTNRKLVHWYENNVLLKFTININELRDDVVLLRCPDSWSIRYNKSTESIILTYDDNNQIGIRINNNTIVTEPPTQAPTIAPTHQPVTPAPTSQPLPEQYFMHIFFEVTSNGKSGNILFYSNLESEDTQVLKDNSIFFENILLPTKWNDELENPSYKTIKNVVICQSTRGGFMEMGTIYQILSILALSILVFLVFMIFVDNNVRRALFGSVFVPVDLTKRDKIIELG